MKTTFKAALAGLATSTAMFSAAFAEDIKVGMLLPYSGVYAALGQDIDDAFSLGLETFGADSGATFEIVREDDEVKPPVGLAKTKKLILQDEVDVMVGVVSSGSNWTAPTQSRPMASNSENASALFVLKRRLRRSRILSLSGSKLSK